RCASKIARILRLDAAASRGLSFMVAARSHRRGFNNGSTAGGPPERRSASSVCQIADALYAEITMLQIGLLVHGGGGQILDNVPVIENVDAVGERHRRGDVLLDDQ